MYDVTVGVVGILAAGHNDKVLVSCVNDLDVVYGKLSVKGDGDDCLHGAFLEKLSDLDIGDLHGEILRWMMNLFDVFIILFFCESYSMKTVYLCEIALPFSMENHIFPLDFSHLIKKRHKL
jgi:hypothetical protein